MRPIPRRRLCRTHRDKICNAPRPANEQFFSVVQIIDTQTRHLIGALRCLDFVLADRPWIPHEVRETPEFGPVHRRGQSAARYGVVLASEQAVVLPELVDGQWRATAEQSARADEADEHRRERRG